MTSARLDELANSNTSSVTLMNWPNSAKNLRYSAGSFFAFSPRKRTWLGMGSGSGLGLGLGLGKGLGLGLGLGVRG